MTKQRFIVLQADRLMWFKKGEMNDCILGEIPITPQTEIIRCGRPCHCKPESSTCRTLTNDALAALA